MLKFVSQYEFGAYSYCRTNFSLCEYVGEVVLMGNLDDVVI